jgi:two-component system NtrC family sensor kinase
MGLALGLGAAGILVVTATWDLRSQQAHLTSLVSLSAERIAEIIRGATRDGMMRNDAEAVHRTIENIGALPGIERIRVFNKEGRIRTSTLAQEVGQLVDVRAEQCTACHSSDRPLERLERKDRVRIFRASDGRRVLGVIAPIHNEAQCTTACHAHPASQRVLGVLDVQLSMASVDEALRSSGQQLSWGLLAAVLGMLALAGLLLWRLVLAPVQRLAGAMAAVGAGDLSIRVPVTSRDEIGALAESWNAMTEELRRTREQLTGLNRTLEERVERKTRELEAAHQRMLVVEKLASLGKLAAVVAHEIGNPLAGIRTYARVLRRKAASQAPPDEEAERILAVVDAETGRCGDIVRNLLQFGRSSGGRFAEEDLGPVLERCRLLLRHQAELQGVTLALERPEALPRVVCDAGQVEQVVLALAMNALDATPAGGTVTIAARPAEGGGLVLAVSDTGCGIPPEDLPRVFDPFFTTKEPGKGVGLGLSIVYGIVTRHGGRIDVDSRVGSGTRFEVHLPPRPPEQLDGPEGSELRGPSHGTTVPSAFVGRGGVGGR